jgi:hypothetical protein
MTCNKCGCVMDVAEDFDFSSDKDGNFTEKYECVGCGAKLYIEGNESEHPKQWSRYGSAA